MSDDVTRRPSTLWQEPDKRQRPVDQVAMLLGHKHLNTTAIHTTPSQSVLSKAVEQGNGVTGEGCVVI
jgi:hypothetical protein